MMVLSQKRGQQMTLGTIIMIVLGIMVLVFLIFGFSTGWGNLWDRITNLGGTKSNVDTIRQACALACSSKSSHEFNILKREVRDGSGAKYIETCRVLSSNKNYTSFKISPCPGL